MKKLAILLVTVTLLLGLSGCGNKDLFDTVYTFRYGIISMPNGEIIEGKVTKWTDYEDGDQLQVTIDGQTYLVHSTNVVLMTKVPE